MTWAADGTPNFGVPTGARTYDENTGPSANAHPKRFLNPVSNSTRIWAHNGLYVDVSLCDDGSLQFAGQDLKTCSTE